MKIIPTPIQDLFIIEPKIFQDERGYFFESFNQQKMSDNNLPYAFVQDNQAMSLHRGIIRGLHFQKPPFAQTKLIRCLQGEILDVAVDIRKNSATFGKHFSVVLSAENKKQLLVPRGFAHGYCVLSNGAEVFYKCDNFYAPQAEGGLRYDDAALNIDWMVKENEIKIAPRDKSFLSLQELELVF